MTERCRVRPPTDVPAGSPFLSSNSRTVKRPWTTTGSPLRRAGFRRVLGPSCDNKLTLKNDVPLRVGPQSPVARSSRRGVPRPRASSGSEPPVAGLPVVGLGGHVATQADVAPRSSSDLQGAVGCGPAPAACASKIPRLAATARQPRNAGLWGRGTVVNGFSVDSRARKDGPRRAIIPPGRRGCSPTGPAPSDRKLDLLVALKCYPNTVNFSPTGPGGEDDARSLGPRPARPAGQ